MDDLLQEFIAETRETLGSLESELVIWENDPTDKQRLDSIFRFFHTIKGSCGFLNLPRFERLSHAAEEVLSQVRDGSRDPSAAMVDAVLAVIDRINELIAVMELGEALSDESDADLIAALTEVPALTDAEMAQAAQHSGEESDKEHVQPTAKIRSIRIPLDLIDHLMNGVSDMVLARNEVARCLRDSNNDPVVDSAFDKLSSCIADLRDAIGQTRMQRIDRIFSPLPRIVRDLASNLGKQVELKTSGNNVELDREMLEMIRDPLTHIIRNAIDHGLESAQERALAGKPETGNLSISARQSGNQILIEIADDGRGLNLEKLVTRAVAAKIKTASEAQNLSDRAKLELIFAPGFSTAETVTAISGRGVGMDVVRSNIEQIGGSIDIENFPGKGLKITMRVPLTLTIMPCLTVCAGGQHFAIPRSAVQEILYSNNSHVRVTMAGGIESAHIRGVRIPYVNLEDILGLDRVDDLTAAKRTIITVIASSALKYALAVESVLDHEELVVRPGAPVIMADGVYAGTTLPDNGRPMLLLDPVGLAERARLNLKYNANDDVPESPNDTAEEEDSQSALLFRTNDGRVCAISLGALERVEDVDANLISLIGGHMRLQVEDGTCPIYALDAVPTRGTVKLLRLSDGQAQIRFAIAEVLDIVRLPIKIEPVSDHKIVAGIAQVDGQLVEVIDTHWIFSHFQADLVPINQQALPVCHLAGSNDQWSRNILAPLIRSAGYRVTYEGQNQAGTVAPDVVVMLDLPADKGLPDLDQANVPVIRLHSGDASTTAECGGINRYDREALLFALQNGLNKKVAS
jgi:two-component system chemotaxis sensor kinase CheA